jgi:hypothetical protein
MGLFQDRAVEVPPTPAVPPDLEAPAEPADNEVLEERSTTAYAFQS